jgi:hypothetical protein
MRELYTYKGLIALGGSLLAGVLATMASKALGDSNLTFRLTNASGYALTELYVSPSFADEWGGDMLKSKVLFSGEAATLAIADGSSTCVYDLRFVAEDGSMMEDVGIDLCAVKSYVLEP